ncbi:methyl-accepting chemotaxis protein [uncultured Ramlibacter sp.]|uniref:methyl-accepting chemotaxis protein n=1 Tax=uncultured Ramlibacter sp. TaxID=260755 RepID=UPI0026061CA8|nr:methyl-accepting chemotaxis protein [uncultured Ramlibacter sp.]
MNVKTRIWMLPVVAAVIFAVGIAVVLAFSARTSAAINSVGSVDYPYLDSTTQFAAQLDALGATVQSAVAEGEKKSLDDAGERAVGIRKLLSTIEKIDGKSAAAAKLKGLFEAYYSASVETAQLFLGIKQGDQAGSIPKMQAALKALETELAQQRKQAGENFASGLSDANAGVSASVTSTILSAIVVVASLVLASFLVIGSVWRQLGGEPEYARDVMRRMAEGDLSQKIAVATGAESSLLAAVRDMSQGLAAIVADVRTGTDSMTVASREISIGNQDLSARTEKQASSLEQTSSNMQQLTEAVRQSADAAAQANQLSGSAAEVAQRGGAVVGLVVSTMNEINASSQKINDIIGVIDGIAFQTNILALNAAVEAARAGEQGRGFAVVASEVRSLAQRSAGAANEIKELISASVEKVESGSRLVRDAGATMDEIVASVQRVSNIVAEITTAANEQSQGIGEVNKSVTQLDHMTQQNAALVEEAAAAATSLEQQALGLQTSVSTFKLG